MCLLKQTRQAKYPILDDNGNVTIVEDMEPKEVLYLIGGFAGWPKHDLRWNGERTRNDVWVSEDGNTWNLVLPPKGRNTMPFVGRGWHACTTWHDDSDRSRGVKMLSRKEEAIKDRGSKLILCGGGYIGTKRNSVVSKLEGYVDMWWSYDGSHWHQINYEEGEKESLYSTNEWTSVTINSKNVFRGKWGHSLMSFPSKKDIDLDGNISNTSISFEFCSGTQEKIGICKEFSMKEDVISSLFIVGGDTTDEGPIVNEVFQSQPGGK